MSMVLELPRSGVGGPGSELKLRLTEDCELLGRYESSAFEQPQYLLRHGDNQLMRVSQILYLLASHLDGRRETEEIAERISADLGRTVSADNVRYLVRHKLQSCGLVTTAGEAPAPQPRAKPLLALRFRAKLLPERAHCCATGALRPLSWPPAVVTVLAGLLALDTWLFATRATAPFGLMRQVIEHPLQFLLPTTVPILLVNVGFFATVAPRVLPALWSAARRQEHLISRNIHHGAIVQGINQAIGMLILAATGAGLLLIAALILLRLGRVVARVAAHRMVSVKYAPLTSSTPSRSVCPWPPSPLWHSASCSGRRPWRVRRWSAAPLPF